MEYITISSDDDEPVFKRQRVELSINENDVFKMVKKCYFEELPVEKAYKEIANKFALHKNSFDLDTFLSHFKQNDEEWLYKLEDQQPVYWMTKIEEYYDSWKKMIHFGEISECEILTSFQPRYDFEIEVLSERKFTLCDSFHGINIEFEIDDSECPFSNLSYHMLAPDKLLAHCQQSHDVLINGRQQVSFFYLLELDFEKQTLHIQDEKRLVLHYVKVMFDLYDPDKFLIVEFLNDNSQKFMCHNNLKDNKIFFKPDVAVYFNPPEHENFEISRNSYGLFGEKLCFLHSHQNDHQTDIAIRTLQYHEIDLSSDGTYDEEDSFKFNFNFNEEDVYLEYLNENSFAWSSNKVCYVNIRLSEIDFSSVYAFDINTQRSAKVNFTCQNINEIKVDNKDDVLILKSDDAVYRQPLKRPDTLEKLTWFKIRQLKIVSKKENVYNEAMKRLPLNSELRPFSFSC